MLLQQVERLVVRLAEVKPEFIAYIVADLVKVTFPGDCSQFWTAINLVKDALHDHLRIQQFVNQTSQDLRYVVCLGVDFANASSSCVPVAAEINDDFLFLRVENSPFIIIRRKRVLHLRVHG